jgi:hypothetical protein
VAVELDVGNVLERAVRRENALLILAAEQGDFDLLALVLVRIILHRAESSRSLRGRVRRVWELEYEGYAG